jgi:multidrug efflux pump subunit AcrA (membrane-fusion protein)
MLNYEFGGQEFDASRGVPAPAAWDSGQIVRLAVHADQYVHKGDLLLEIDLFRILCAP